MSTDSEVSAARRPSVLGHSFRVGLIGLAVLVSLAVIVVIFENWRGKRAWEKYRAEWEAKGERFDLASFIPPPVPPAENFAMTPLLAPLLDYTSGRPPQWKDPDGSDRAKALGDVFTKYSGRRKVPATGRWELATATDLRPWQTYFEGNTNFPSTDPPQDSPAKAVLDALRKFAPVIEELRAASARPYSHFPIHYDETFNALLPHLGTLKGLAQIVRLRALAELAANQPAEALADVKLCLRLADSLKSEPLLISQLVRISILNLTMQPIWEGLERRQWNEDQLADLQSTLSNNRVLEDFGRTIRGERAFGNGLLDQMLSGALRDPNSVMGGDDGELSNTAMRYLPGGWIRHNQVVLNRLFQERCLPLVELEKYRVHPDLARVAEDVPELKKAGIYNVFARLLFPAVAKTSTRFAQAQTTLDEAAIACALERYRLARGQYPDTLEALVPQFIAKLPTDLINGEPLKYRRTDDGLFVLYSVGWNQTDDGGEIRPRKARDGVNASEGDWVWRYSPGPASP